MNDAKIKKLWAVFLEKIEPDFKERLGYGKEEIEAIGISNFFEKMGWTDESQLESYKTDILHIVPCVDCKENFACYEEDLGLCDECLKKYDVDSVFKFYQDTLERSGAQDAHKIMVGFYASPEFRKEFLKKPDNAIEYAMFRVEHNKNKDANWRIVALQDLERLLKEHPEGEYKLIQHDGKEFSQNGEVTIFTGQKSNLV